MRGKFIKCLLDSKKSGRVTVRIGACLLAICMVGGMMVSCSSKSSEDKKFEEAVKLEEEKKFVAAINEYESVLQKEPENKDAMINILEASYKSENVSKMNQMIELLNGKELTEEEEKLMNDIMLDYAKYYFLPDELNNKLSQVSDLSVESTINIVKPYYDENSSVVSVGFYLGNSYIKVQKFSEAKTVLENVVSIEPGFNTAKMLLAYAYVELGETEKATSLAQDVLKENVESSDANAINALVKIKSKDNTGAVEDAKKAYELDKDNKLASISMVLAYHFNGQAKERDEVYTQMKENGYLDTEEISYYDKVISGDINWVK